MRYDPASKSTSFFVELTVVILVFAFSSAIALGLFSNARQIDTRTTNATIAAVKVQTLAETAKSLPSSEGMALFADAAQWPRYFDRDWNSVSTANGAAFYINADFSSELTTAGTMVTVGFSAISASDDENPLFELEVKKYYSY